MNEWMQTNNKSSERQAERDHNLQYFPQRRIDSLSQR